jgi:crystallin alpha B
MAALIPLNHPWLSGDWWDISPARIFDQNFGMGLLNDPLTIHPWHGSSPYWLRHRHHERGAETGVSEVKNDKHEFAINLDVSHFKPEEIKVKAKDNTVEVSAKHEEKMDQHGFVSRAFTRRYVLPKDVDVTHLSSHLTNDGVLCVQAPKIVKEDESKERVIPIEMKNHTASIKGQQQQPQQQQQQQHAPNGETKK